jgi:hypothetical protein
MVDNLKMLKYYTFYIILLNSKPRICKTDDYPLFVGVKRNGFDGFNWDVW